MSTDITFCANALQCPAQTDCLRAQIILVPSSNLSFAAFEPEKGEGCEGYKPITKEQQ